MLCSPETASCKVYVFRGSRRLKPVVNQAAGYGCFVRDLWHIVTSEPAAFAQFLLLQTELAAGIVCREAYHEAEWVGPGLGVEVADILDFDASLLAHLASHSIHKRLSRLQEACDKAMMRAAEILGADKENLCVGDGIADHSTARGWIADHSTARGGIADRSTARGRIANHSTARGGIDDRTSGGDYRTGYPDNRIRSISC